MAVKSAIMTTSARVKTGNGKLSHDYFAQGVGNVRPDRMFNPGVIFDAKEKDWLSFLEGVGINTDTAAKAIDSTDYNAPSIAIGELGGSQKVTRRVTAVKRGSYQTTISVLGVTATVSPSILHFPHAGQTKTVTIAFAPDGGQLSQTVFGSLKLEGAGTLARLPIVVGPAAPEAQAVVTGTAQAVR
jgi:hypothetical protein